MGRVGRAEVANELCLVRVFFCFMMCKSGTEVKKVQHNQKYAFTSGQIKAIIQVRSARRELQLHQTNVWKPEKLFLPHRLSHTHLLLRPAAHPPQAQMGACHRGNMEREGMQVQAIYYGRIGSEATERLLERFGREGSFLLRDSETVQGAYCLCVRWAACHAFPSVTVWVCWLFPHLGRLFIREYSECFI